MTISHTDVIAKLDGRPMNFYGTALAELHGRTVPVTPEPTEAERQAWRAHAWLVDCIDADSKRNEP
jgi:hypothetical protein